MKGLESHRQSKHYEKRPAISWAPDDSLLYPRNELIITAGRSPMLGNLSSLPLPYAVFFGIMIFCLGVMVVWAVLLHARANDDE